MYCFPKLSEKYVNMVFCYIGFNDIEKVIESQIWKFNVEDITVCAKGMKWIHILSKDLVWKM